MVTAVFNCADTLEATIQSVLCQTYSHVEYIIIDGGSTDGTLDIIRKYDDAIDYWLSEPDKGIYDAFNKACPLVTGEWTIFLGAGDLFYDSGILAKVALAAQNAAGETELLYGRVCVTDTHSSAIKLVNRPWTEMSGRWRGGRPMMPHHQGIFHGKNLLHVKLPFDTKYRIAADSTVVYASLQRAKPFFIDAVVARASIGGVSTDPKSFLAIAHEILRINRRFGHRNYVHQSWFYIKTLAKALIYRIGGEAPAKKVIDEYRVLTGRKRKWKT